ncbi:MAG: ABC transporter ATP-binding protein [Anaerolineales bacterium]|nr:ABC transporter ATP-binding protein [Anaerolineales bacterium]
MIQVENVTKDYGQFRAVDDISFAVEKGDILGLLGPNGAGKTTIVKMLLGLIKPSAGTGSVLGEKIGDHRRRAHIGFLPEHFRFHDWLTASEFLYLHADLYQIPRASSQKRVPELLELVSLTPHADKKLRQFSKGMLQRIGIAQALLNQPKLVILDEPTSGLDPVGRRLVRDIIRELRERGTTVFLNSHLLSEVEITCDRVAFIKHGEVLQVSTIQSLMDGELTVEARVRNLGPEVVSGLSRWSQNVRADGEHLSLTLSSEADLPAVNRYLVEAGVEVYSLRPQNISLEDLFIQIVGTDGGL